MIIVAYVLVGWVLGAILVGALASLFFRAAALPTPRPEDDA